MFSQFFVKVNIGVSSGGRCALLVLSGVSVEEVPSGAECVCALLANITTLLSILTISLSHSQVPSDVHNNQQQGQSDPVTAGAKKVSI